MGAAFQRILCCKRTKLLKKLKANHNKGGKGLKSAICCKRTKLLKKLKANHNIAATDQRKRYVVKELSYLKN